jgi:hypothetical protein
MTNANLAGFKKYRRKILFFSLLHLKSIMANPFQRGVRSERNQKPEGGAKRFASALAEPSRPAQPLGAPHRGQ